MWNALQSFHWTRSDKMLPYVVPEGKKEKEEEVMTKRTKVSWWICRPPAPYSSSSSQQQQQKVADDDDDDDTDDVSLLVACWYSMYGMVSAVALASGLMTTVIPYFTEDRFVMRTIVLLALFIGELIGIFLIPRPSITSISTSTRILCYLCTITTPFIMMEIRLAVAVLGAVILMAGGVYKNQLWAVTTPNETHLVLMSSNLMATGLFAFCISEYMFFVWLLLLIIIIETAMYKNRNKNWDDAVMLTEAMDTLMGSMVQKKQNDDEEKQQQQTRGHYCTGVAIPKEADIMITMFLAAVITAFTMHWQLPPTPVVLLIFSFCTLLGNMLFRLISYKMNEKGGGGLNLWNALVFKILCITIPFGLMQLTVAVNGSSYTDLWYLFLNMSNGISWGIVQSLYRSSVPPGVIAGRRAVSLCSAGGLCVGAMIIGFTV